MNCLVWDERGRVLKVPFRETRGRLRSSSFGWRPAEPFLEAGRPDPHVIAGHQRFVIQSGCAGQGCLNDGRIAVIPLEASASPPNGASTRSVA
jgi:hypothetical protein